MIPTKFSHCCEDSEPHIRLPRLRIQERYWESPGNLTLKASRIWWQDFHKTEGNRDSTLQGHKQNLCAPRLTERSSAPTVDWTSQFSSVTQSCLTLGDPMNRRTPGLPVHHQLLEFTQTHVHWVSDAIQPSHPQLSPSPFNFPQHQGLLKWVSSLHQVDNIGVSASASGLAINIQDWFPLGWTGCISLQSERFSRVFSKVFAWLSLSSLYKNLIGYIPFLYLLW